MPPQREAAADATAERRRAIAWLTGQDRAVSGQPTRSRRAQTVLRRLNAREYRNTVRDLLHLNMTMFDPTAGFPRDQTDRASGQHRRVAGHFGPLLQRYLAAADRIDRQGADAGREAARANLGVPRQLPPAAGDRPGPRPDQRLQATSRCTTSSAADKPEGAYGPILAFKNGVPFDGTYEIRFKAEAVNRLHPYDPEFVGTDRDEPLRLGSWRATSRPGPLHKPQPIEPLLAEVDLADEPQWYTVRVWLDAGFTPRFTFRNGLMDVRKMWARMVNRYPRPIPRAGAARDRRAPVQRHQVRQAPADPYPRSRDRRPVLRRRGRPRVSEPCWATTGKPLQRPARSPKKRSGGI